MTTRLLEIEAASDRLRSTMPVSGSTKPPPSEVTRPENCGADAVPVTAMSTLSAPCSAAPRAASWRLPSDSGTAPVTRRLSGAPAAVPTVPVTWTRKPVRAGDAARQRARRRPASVPSAVTASGAEPGIARGGDRCALPVADRSAPPARRRVPVTVDGAGDRALRAEIGREAVGERRGNGVELGGEVERRAGAAGDASRCRRRR